MPKKKHGSVFYYLVIERGKETFFLETLKHLAERWLVETPRRVLWVTIALDVSVGYIGAAIKSTRRGHSLSSEAHLPTVISETAESNYQSIALYVSTYLGQEEDVKKVIADLDYRWKYAGIEPVDGIASSISTSTIDFGDIDQWLVACLGCCYIWHPIKDDPELQNERYRALYRVLNPEIPPIEQVDLRRAKDSGLFPLIETTKLSARNLPSDDSVWFDINNERDPRSVMGLALSFAGYDFMDMKMFELLGVVESLAFGGQERILECFNTTGLRLLLFALQRRQHNADTGLKTDSLTRAIVGKLRARLS